MVGDYRIGEFIGCTLARIGGALMWPGNALANTGTALANRSIDRRNLDYSALNYPAESETPNLSPQGHSHD